MDDYLIKPINLEKLKNAMGGIASDVGAAQGVVTASDADAIVDGLKSFGDAAVIGELIDLFLGDAPGKIAQAQKAIDSGTPPRHGRRFIRSRAVPQPARRSVGPCV